LASFSLENPVFFAISGAAKPIAPFVSTHCLEKTLAGASLKKINPCWRVFEE
jgi:hypothetical protein